MFIIKFEFIRMNNTIELYQNEIHFLKNMDLLKECIVFLKNNTNAERLCFDYP